MSFKEGHFPSRFKTAQVTPLLKKQGLDKTLPSNYRPISNLNNISKILERLFLNRIQSHLTSCSNFNPFQSAYRRNHSTETALLYTINNVYKAAADGRCTVLVSLDLSAAFDTIDHATLFSRLDNSFGIRDKFLSWIESYVGGRSQFVRIGKASSIRTPCPCGTPQGSTISPILFTVYTSPIAAIAASHNVHQQQYADDTQLYIALSAPDLSSNIQTLENCLRDLNVWFCQNGLALNPDKSDAIVFGTRPRLDSLPSLNNIKVAGSDVKVSDNVKILGVTLDKHLTLNDHVNMVCKSSFYHLRSFRHIRSALTQDVAKTVGCAVVGAKLDYANSLLHGASVSNINRLQRVQNALARVVLSSPSSSATANLKHLHWLPVEYRIRYKLCTLTYRARSSSAPFYLSSLVSPYIPSRSLRSSNANMLTVPRANIKFADKGFYIAGPSVWNSLPSDIRSAESLNIFCTRLKTHFYRRAFAEQ